MSAGAFEPDTVCEHGTAWDVHCCGCHSGFLFDPSSCVCLDDYDEIDEADQRLDIEREEGIR